MIQYEVRGDQLGKFTWHFTNILHGILKNQWPGHLEHMRYQSIDAKLIVRCYYVLGRRVLSSLTLTARKSIDLISIGPETVVTQIDQTRSLLPKQSNNRDRLMAPD